MLVSEGARDATEATSRSVAEAHVRSHCPKVLCTCDDDCAAECTFAEQFSAREASSAPFCLIGTLLLQGIYKSCHPIHLGCLCVATPCFAA